MSTLESAVQTLLDCQLETLKTKGAFETAQLAWRDASNVEFAALNALLRHLVGLIPTELRLLATTDLEWMTSEGAFTDQFKQFVGSTSLASQMYAKYGWTTDVTVACGELYGFANYQEMVEAFERLREEWSGYIDLQLWGFEYFTGELYAIRKHHGKMRFASFDASRGDPQSFKFCSLIGDSLKKYTF